MLWIYCLQSIFFSLFFSVPETCKVCGAEQRLWIPLHDSHFSKCLHNPCIKFLLRQTHFCFYRIRRALLYLKFGDIKLQNFPMMYSTWHSSGIHRNNFISYSNSNKCMQSIHKWCMFIINFLPFSKPHISISKIAVTPISIFSYQIHFRKYKYQNQNR